MSDEQPAENEADAELAYLETFQEADDGLCIPRLWSIKYTKTGYRWRIKELPVRQMSPGE